MKDTGRLRETRQLRELLVTHDLRVSSTFAPYPSTRTPWPARRACNNSTQLSLTSFLPQPTSKWSSGHVPTIHPGVRRHKPIGLAALANPPKRNLRKILWNHAFAPPIDWSKHLATHWEPTQPAQWARDLREMSFDSLSDLAPALLDKAKLHQTRRTEAQVETNKLRDATHNTHNDPDLHLAYQIRLQEHQEQQRRHREHIKLLNKPAHRTGTSQSP